MKRFMRFQLRTFLLGILTVSAVCGWLGKQKTGFDAEQRSLAELSEIGVNLHIFAEPISNRLPSFL